MRRRKEFKDLVTANSNLTYSHYWRLVALASVDFCFTVPLATCFIILNVRRGVHPWVSWDDTHSEYSRVYQFPKVLADQNPLLMVGFQITQWATVLCAFVFFGFFGFADEAMENYRLLASTVAKRLGCKMVSSNSRADQLPTMNFSMNEVPQIPESVLNLASVRRPSIADAPKFVSPDGALKQV